MTNSTGNLAPLPAIFPDQSAPVVRQSADGRELAMMCWGMSLPCLALKTCKTDPSASNIRNLGSPHMRRWLGLMHRCLVPFTSFSKYRVGEDESRTAVWFAKGEDRPLIFFAGSWTEWIPARKVKEGEVTTKLYGFLTCEANATLGAVHSKAMLVILEVLPGNWTLTEATI